MAIEYPSLEIRNEDQLVAESVSRVSGGLTAEIVKAQIRERQEILQQIEAGLQLPICPELTNANPSSPHTVLLEAMGWQLAQLGFRFNRVPEQNHIAFANLFGVEPIPATFAGTTLKFSVSDAVNSTTIPEGTEISDEDGLYLFETVEDLIIPNGVGNGYVGAVRTVPGHTILAPNILTEMVDVVAFVDGVTNESAIDAGTEAETLANTLERVKRYQKRGERIVSSKDLESAILDEALNGNGIVRAFSFIENGDFGTSKLGNTSVIVLTSKGEIIDDISRQKIGALLGQVIGNQSIYIVNPFFVEFDVAANVKLINGIGDVSLIEKNLRDFYAASAEQFGKPILRSEVIAIIEGTSGVDRIEALTKNLIIASPVRDLKLNHYELPKVRNVTINVV